MKEYFLPMASVAWGIANKMEYHHSFTIRYARHLDMQLAIHKDDSDITLNICLGKQFTGGGLYFHGCKPSKVIPIPSNLHAYEIEHRKTTLAHSIGYGVMHMGCHLHGASDIEEGERMNLIMWCKSKPYE